MEHFQQQQSPNTDLSELFRKKIAADEVQNRRSKHLRAP